MKQNNFKQLLDEVVNGLNDQFRETVCEAYDLGFKNGSESVKRYAVNVSRLDGETLKDIFKQFTTLEDAQTYMKRVMANDYIAYLYEYNYVNDQYESIDESMEI